jgi:hypothetical protein
MIRRNLLKFLGALSLVPVFKVSADETYMGAKIIRLEAKPKHVFIASTKTQNDSGKFIDGPKRIFCLVANEDDKYEVWCPLNKEKESEKEMLEMTLDNKYYKSHNYCHIIRYKDLVGYLCTSEPYKLVSIIR